MKKSARPPYGLLLAALLCFGCSQNSNDNRAGAQTSTPARVEPLLTPKRDTARSDLGVDKIDAAKNVPDGGTDAETGTEIEVENETKTDGAEFPISSEAAITELKFPVDIYEPVVAFSKAHESTNLLRVGDTVADLPLSNKQSLRDVVERSKLTVLVLWSRDAVFAAEQFANLPREVAAVFGTSGVQTIAIEVGGAQQFPKAIDGVVCCTDPSRAIYQEFATDYLPRTYVIDDKGTVLWLDIEYSRSMRVELRNAIWYYLRRSSS